MYTSHTCDCVATVVFVSPFLSSAADTVRHRKGGPKIASERTKNVLISVNAPLLVQPPPLLLLALHSSKATQLSLAAQPALMSHATAVQSVMISTNTTQCSAPPLHLSAAKGQRAPGGAVSAPPAQAPNISSTREAVVLRVVLPDKTLFFGSSRSVSSPAPVNILPAHVQLGLSSREQMAAEAKNFHATVIDKVNQQPDTPQQKLAAQVAVETKRHRPIPNFETLFVLNCACAAGTWTPSCRRRRRSATR